MIRLELASSWQFPKGSAGRSYLLRLPLTDEGEIVPTALESQPLRATVRRYWPNEADLIGHLIRTPSGFAIRYETNGGGAPTEGRNGNGAASSPLFQFGADTIKVGEELFLTEPDGHSVKYRVANLQ